MRLLRLYLRAETAELAKNNICLKVIGEREQLDADIVRLIENAEEISKDNDGIVLMIAINYGGRQDIASAALAIAKEIEAGMLAADDVYDDLLKSRMSTKILPPVDLLIRTGGEKRLSNFLLWDLSYAELFFSDKLWPDFTRSDLFEAITSFQGRQRRFGGGHYDTDQSLRVVVSD